MSFSKFALENVSRPDCCQYRRLPRVRHGTRDASCHVYPRGRSSGRHSLIAVTRLDYHRREFVVALKDHRLECKLLEVEHVTLFMTISYDLRTPYALNLQFSLDRFLIFIMRITRMNISIKIGKILQLKMN